MDSIQPSEPYIKIAHSIQEQMMVCKLSAQQRRILDLILRLSIGCNRKSAYIPLQKDFTAVGVAEAHISTHLYALERDKVIFRNGPYYAINLKFDWGVGKGLEYNPERIRELVHLNLEVPDSEVTENVSPVTDSVRRNYRFGKSREANLASPKESLNNAAGIDLDLPEPAAAISLTRGVTENVSPVTEPVSRNKEEDVSHESAGSAAVPSALEAGGGAVPPDGAVPSNNESADISRLANLYEQTFGRIITSRDSDELKDMCHSYRSDWLTRAFGEAKAGKARSLNYVLKILARYDEQGGPSAGVPPRESKQERRVKQLLEGEKYDNTSFRR